MTKSRLFF